MSKKKKSCCFSESIATLFLVSFILASTGCSSRISLLPYLHLDEFVGKVVDSETKKPIDGAVILAVYYYEAITPVGTRDYIIDGQETLTGENGEFRVPCVRKWFVADRGFTRGNLNIFKPGYGAFPEHRQSSAIGVEYEDWPPSSKYVVYELPRLKTKEERKKHVIYMNTYNEISYQKRKLYMTAINEERVALGMPPRTIPNEEGRK